MIQQTTTRHVLFLTCIGFDFDILTHQLIGSSSMVQPQKYPVITASKHPATPLTLSPVRQRQQQQQQQHEKTPKNVSFQVGKDKTSLPIHRK